MLRIDKDMERLMMEKKKEVLFDLEKAKKRILEELYCLRRSVHTDVCGLLADYNRIQLELRELVESLKNEIEETTNSFSQIFAETYNSYTIQINQHITNFEEVKNSIVTEINEALADLTYMEETVNGLTEQLNDLAGTYVTQEELAAMKTELETAISDAVSSIDFEQFKTEVEEMIVQSDWDVSDETDKSFIKHKPFGLVYENVLYYEHINMASNYTAVENKNAIISLDSDFSLNDGSLYEVTFTTNNTEYTARVKAKNRAFTIDGETIETPVICNTTNWYFTDSIFVESWKYLKAFTNDALPFNIIKHPSYGMCFVTYCDVNGTSTSKFGNDWTFEIKKIIYSVVDPLFLGSYEEDGVLTLYKNNVTWQQPFYTKGKARMCTTKVLGKYDSVDGLPSDTQQLFVVGNDYDIYVNGNYFATTTASKVTDTCIKVYDPSGDWSGFIVVVYIFDGMVFIKAQSDGTVDVAKADVITIYEHDYSEEINPVNAFKLISPSGSIYRVSVSDDGTLSTEAVTE